MRVFPRNRDLSEELTHVDLRVRGSDLQQPESEVHIRLDAFLQRFLTWRSRTSIQELIREGFVALDPSSPSRPDGHGEYAVEKRPGRRLLHGTKVRIEIPEPLRVQRTIPAADGLTVLHEDEHLLAIDKPAFLPVHPSGRHLSDTLIQRIHVAYDQRKERREFRIKLCHRLDRETSGIVMCARDPVSHAAVMKQFEVRDVEKEYLAIVWGGPDEQSGTVDLPMGPDRSSEVRLKMATVPDGIEARTHWRVVERFSDCTLIAAKPFSGRQHQIRVHLAVLGLPLVGDKLYGSDEQLFLRASRGELDLHEERALGLPRHALHNHRLALTHPRTGEKVEVRSALPEDMRRFLDQRS